MHKQITYFDPRATDSEHPNGQEIVINVHTQEEFDITMTAIENLEREIPQDSIVIEELPDEPALTLDEFAEAFDSLAVALTALKNSPSQGISKELYEDAVEALSLLGIKTNEEN